MTMAATSATTTAAVLSNTNAHHHQKWMRCSDVGMVSLPTSNWEPFATRWRPHTRSPLLVPRAASAETAGKDNKRKKKKRPDEEEDDDGGKDKQEQEQEQEQQLQQASVSMISLDDVNPVGLGRKSRQIFDEVWRKFSGLGQISRTTRTDEETLLIREGGPMCEFAIPGAQNTTVLVVGATSRIGRIVVRKLMLRGYTVKVLKPLLCIKIPLFPTLNPEFRLASLLIDSAFRL